MKETTQHRLSPGAESLDFDPSGKAFRSKLCFRARSSRFAVDTPRPRR
jgi:hypothetical protein